MHVFLCSIDRLAWDIGKVIENETLKKLMDPPLLVEKEQFLVKFAENQDEINAAKRLRYNVFMAEQGHLAGKTAETAIDEDEFSIIDSKNKKLTFEDFPMFLQVVLRKPV